MNITLPLSFANQTINVNMQGNDTESLTLADWDELYHSAQIKNLPYYWLSIVIIENNGHYKANCYDGSSLEKLKKRNEVLLDPLTRQPLLAIHNLFFNCFELEFPEKDGVVLKALKSPEMSSFSFDDISNSDMEDFAKASLNVMSETSSSSTLREQIGKIQYIIGSNLFKLSEVEKNIEGIRWLAASAAQGIHEANALLQQQGLPVIDKRIQ